MRHAGAGSNAGGRSAGSEMGVGGVRLCDTRVTGWNNFSHVFTAGLYNMRFVSCKLFEEIILACMLGIAKGTGASAQ